MDDLIRPNLTGEFYRSTEAVRIVNHIQANYYLSQGIKVLDLYVSRGKTIYVFRRSDTQELFKKWNDRSWREEQLEDECQK